MTRHAELPPAVGETERTRVADASRELRAAVGRSRHLARQGQLVQAVDSLRVAWGSIAGADREPDAAAQAVSLRAEHAFLVGDSRTASSVLSRSWSFLRHHRTTVVEAHLSIAITRLDAALRATGVPVPTHLAEARRLDEVIPLIRSKELLARCLLARAELRLDAQDLAGATEDAHLAAQLWSKHGHLAVDLACAQRAEGEARGLNGDREAASELLTGALRVFVEHRLHLAAAETRHAIAEIELRTSDADDDRGEAAMTDLIATLVYLHSLRLTFPSETQRVLWARHIVEPALALAIEFAVRRADAVLVADLIAATRAVGVPTVRPSPASRGSYRLPVAPVHEIGIDLGGAIDRPRAHTPFDVSREPAPEITMPDGRTALARYLIRAREIYPGIRTRADGGVH